MKKNKQNKKFYIVMIVVLLAILALSFLLSYREETTTTKVENKSEIVFLSCQQNLVKNYPLFSDDNYDNVELKILAKFVDNQITSVSAEISKKFTDSNSAETFTNMLHANYDNYTGSRGINKKGITPSYTSIDSNSKMVIFIEEKALNDKTTPLVLIDQDRLNESSVENIEQNYEKKDFICEKIINNKGDQ